MEQYSFEDEKIGIFKRKLAKWRAWWRVIGAPLFKKLEVREIAIWGTFFAVCIVVATTILGFIGEFIQEQDKYAEVLTSTRSTDSRAFIEDMDENDTPPKEMLEDMKKESNR